MTKITKETAGKEHEKRRKKFTEKDLDKILEAEENLKSKFKSQGRLKRFFEDIQILFSMIKDYINGSYREVPWKIIASIGGTLLYVLSPIDLIPDFIPIVGYLDDAAVVAFCLNFVEDDLVAYKIWKDKVK